MAEHSFRITAYDLPHTILADTGDRRMGPWRVEGDRAGDVTQRLAYMGDAYGHGIDPHTDIEPGHLAIAQELLDQYGHEKARLIAGEILWLLSSEITNWS